MFHNWNIMDLNALEDFNLVVAHGGFGRASRATGRPKATLSRRVSELEQSLGVRLIERGGHSLRLTGEGRGLHERTGGLLAELKEAGEAVASQAQAPRGPLRVSAPAVLAHAALAAVGARFALAHPQIQLEIVAEDRKVDPVEEGYDLVIRVNPPPDERLSGRIVLYDRLWLVAGPQLPRPRLSRDEETPVSAIMSCGAPPDVKWRIRGKDRAIRTLLPQPLLRLSTLLMVHEAALAGAGAALLPQLLVEEDVRAGRLACWGSDDGPPVEIWALYSSRRLLSLKVRAFIDALVEAFPDKRFAGG